MAAEDDVAAAWGPTDASTAPPRAAFLDVVPSAATFGVGSLPHRDVGAAAHFSFEAFDVLTLPSLPRRSPAEAAVAQVSLNRVKNPAYPNSICGVVYQNKSWRNRCQFSFACDGKPDRPRDAEAYDLAGRIADYLLRGGARTLTHGATHFHAGAVKPGWSRVLARTTRIGSHHFYRL